MGWWGDRKSKSRKGQWKGFRRWALRPFALGVVHLPVHLDLSYHIVEARTSPCFLLSLAVTCGWVMIDAQKIAAWSSKTEESERG